MIYNYSKKLCREVSALGFGCWGIGGNLGGPLGYGRVDDTESTEAIYEALDQGINFFDTSNIYGNGHSETVLGKALLGIREQVIIATKAGKLATGESDFSPQAIERSLICSLKRLRTDHVDLLQLHDPRPFSLQNLPEQLESLTMLKQKGLVKCIGVSLKSPTDAFFFHRTPFDILQFNFNLLDQRALDELVFDKSQDGSFEIIVRTPLAFGFLTNRFNHEFTPQFTSDDHRSRWSDAQIKIWHTAPEKFKAILDEFNINIIELAFYFAVSQLNTICVLSGMMKSDEVRQNARILSHRFNFSDSLLQKVSNIYRANTFFLN